MAGYLGNNPSDSSVRIARQIYTTSGVTTDFTFTSGYDPGYIDVYVNGERQTEGTNFTANDGSTVIILNGGVSTGSTVECAAYKTFNVATVTLGEVTDVDDLTITGAVNAGSGDIGIATIHSSGIDAGVGVITAASYVGDGSSLTGIASTDIINAEQVNVSGSTTTGIATVSTSVVVGSAVTVTATAININPTVTTTIGDSGNVDFSDDAKARFGTGNDLSIYHSGSHSFINDSGTGNLKILSSQVDILNPASNETIATFAENGAVSLYYDNSKKWETTNDGTVTTGIGTFTTGVAIDATFSEASSDGNDLVIGSTSDTAKGLSIVGSTSGGIGNIFFSDGASYKNQGNIQYRHADDSMRFSANQSEALRITSAGRIGINSTAPSDRLTVEHSNTGNPTGITIKNTNTNAHSHARLKLISQNGEKYTDIWTDVPNDSCRIGYNGSSSLMINNGNAYAKTTVSSWHNDYRVFQAGQASMVGKNPTDGSPAYFSNNAYYDASDSRWEFISTDDACQIEMENGSIKFKNGSTGSANGAITWSTSATFNQSGNLAFGNGKGIETLVRTGIKTALSIRNNTPNEITYIESDQYPLECTILKQQLKFWLNMEQHMKDKPQTPLSNLISLAQTKKLPYITHYMKLKEKYTSPENCMETLKSEYRQKWTTQINKASIDPDSKFGAYKRVNPNFISPIYKVLS